MHRTWLIRIRKVCNHEERRRLVLLGTVVGGRSRRKRPRRTNTPPRSFPDYRRRGGGAGRGKWRVHVDHSDAPPSCEQSREIEAGRLAAGWLRKLPLS